MIEINGIKTIKKYFIITNIKKFDMCHCIVIISRHDYPNTLYQST